MKRARFTQERIIVILREHEGGAKTAGLPRKIGVTVAKIYNGDVKFGGMYMSEATWLDQFEDEIVTLNKALS